jgi:methylated-DNA-[protein]-cysteine S-methyltransferase
MRTFETINRGYLESPLGLILIEASLTGLERVSFVDKALLEELPSPTVEQTQKQLTEFFNGERRVFELSIYPLGTHFQRNVWEELGRIPYGSTRSYEDIARRLGDIKVIRAAATANGKNLIAIIVPCHRVIGKDGSLTGYSGGLWRKKWLLDFEQRDVQPPLL